MLTVGVLRHMRHRARSVALMAALLLGAALVVPGPPEAAAATSLEHVFAGGGWGHGLGMSQYGARGQAEAGRDFRQILTHYYQNTSVSASSMPSSLRVGVLWSMGEIRITGNGPYELRYGSPSGELLAQGSSGQEWRVLVDANGSFVLVGPAGQRIGRSRAKSLFVLFSHFGTLMRLPQTGFRYGYGHMEIDSYAASGAYRLRGIIAGISMARYLYGLGEVPSSWHSEALKAQAVAGATYAAEKVARLGQHRAGCNCGLYSNTFDQVYVGHEKILGASGARWKAAVDATGGLAVVSGGKPIEAYYSSSDGGHTENNENVWGGTPRSYLRGVPDPWDAVSPHHRWKVTYTHKELQDRLNTFSDTRVGTLFSLEVRQPLGISGRVLRVLDSSRGGVRISGSSATKLVSGDRIRQVLSLRSTLFRLNSAAVHPNGTLLKGSAATVYLLDGGRLRPFTSKRTLTTWAATSEIVRVPDAWLLQYDGDEWGFRNGTLIRTPGGGVWLISDGMRRGFSSAAVFDGLGYNWEAIVDVTSAEAGIHRVGPPITGGPHPNGTLMRGSASGVFWIQDGKRRGIPSLRIFETWFDSDEVVTVSDETLESFPNGNLLGFRSGKLIRTPGGTIWAISRGQRRGFTSWSYLTGLGYRPESIINVTWSEAELHPVGSKISSASWHPTGALIQGSVGGVFGTSGRKRLQVSSDKVFDSWNYAAVEIARPPDAKVASYKQGNPPVGFRDGTLIRVPRGTVYIISDGRRRGFSSALIFDRLGYDWDQIIAAAPREAGLHPVGPAIRSSAKHPDGTIMRARGTNGVWWIDDGRRRGVASAAAFESRFRWSEIITVSPERLATYAQGAPLGFRDGALIRTPNGTVWAVSDGKRRGFTSRAVFDRLGYRWANVAAASWRAAELHPYGTPIR